MMANTTGIYGRQPFPKQNMRCIKGGTWEAFERILKNGGYFKNGLRKVEAARTIAARINSNCNRSHSFIKFRDALIEAMT